MTKIYQNNRYFNDFSDLFLSGTESNLESNNARGGAFCTYKKKDILMSSLRFFTARNHTKPRLHFYIKHLHFVYLSILNSKYKYKT